MAIPKKVVQNNPTKGTVLGSKKLSNDSIISQFKPKAKLHKRASNMSMEFERESTRDLHHSASQHKEFKLPSIRRNKLEQTARV